MSQTLRNGLSSLFSPQNGINHMNRRTISVLLVGEAPGNSLELLLWLYKRGCRCHFAASFRDACTLISSTELDLVLTQYHLPDRTSFSLSDWLVGSRASLFLATEVESGILWLPILERGKRCVGAPMLRPSGFAEALERALGPAVVPDSISSARITEFQLQNTLPQG
jgi:hypothetical protein